jgi:hypothetical protein
MMLPLSLRSAGGNRPGRRCHADWPARDAPDYLRGCQRLASRMRNISAESCSRVGGSMRFPMLKEALCDGDVAGGGLQCRIATPLAQASTLGRGVPANGARSLAKFIAQTCPMCPAAALEVGVADPTQSRGASAHGTHRHALPVKGIEALYSASPSAAEPSSQSTARVKSDDGDGFSRRSLIVVVRRGSSCSELEKPVTFRTDDLLGAEAPTKAAGRQADVRVCFYVVVPRRPMDRTKIRRNDNDSVRIGEVHKCRDAGDARFGPNVGQ